MKSPQILELSGIGRKDILDKAGVEVKVELPGVGENLQDHLYGIFCWGASSLSFAARSTYVADEPLVNAELKPEYRFLSYDVLKHPESRLKQEEL